MLLVVVLLLIMLMLLAMTEDYDDIDDHVDVNDEMMKWRS